MEVTAWALDASARGAMVISGIFLGVALLRTAKISVGCDVSCEGSDCPDPAPELGDCNEKVFGFKPSSLLAVMGMVVGILAAITMPVIGAIVDHTNYRWKIGAISALGLVLINFVQSFLSQSTWALVAFLQIAAPYIYLVHCVVQYAYLPELTSDKNELSDITAQCNMWQFLTQVGYIIVVQIFAISMGTGAVGTARISQILLVGWSAFFFYVPWAEMFGHRPALSSVPDGETLLSVGFSRIRKTVQEMRTEYNAVFVCLCAVAFSEAGANAFTTIAVSYCDEVLQMSATETSGLILICLVVAVPSSIVFSNLTKRIGAHKSFMLSLAWWAIVTLVAPLFMNGPTHKANGYVFGIFWGMGFGWIYPTQRALYCLLIPGGQESELMGIYIFAGQILVWMPPAIFTLLNEASVSMAWGLASDACFFLVALGIAYSMGDFELAMMKAKATLGKRVMGAGADGALGGANEGLTDFEMPGKDQMTV
eukprot:CAMPEP_0118659814 /NCGR_PEP_ID=MMETSP0785-20121206/15320_1 /TAXON_ID=91992 /ORGANISM="Bolidomonas pacifica, Strain CCMP 1866" /LENGTH=480 /DNA_ID=CAMNT_0006552959 /DNA_START=90 /DNA_END=1532 /DNA_ORIENTATION=+